MIVSNVFPPLLYCEILTFKLSPKNLFPVNHNKFIFLEIFYKTTF